ncbi:MAG: CpaF family protein [Chloroflexi bacterium]|nr:CpaF family protein [Chloroflexota bacterium]
MILPERYDPILDAGRRALQREAAARGVTRPAELPDAVVDACCAEAIAAFNRGLLFRDAEAEAGSAGPVLPYRDDAAGRAVVRAYLLGFGPADEPLRDDTLEDLCIQGHATFIARYGHSDDPTAPPPGKRLIAGCFRDDRHLVDVFRTRLEEVGAVWDPAHRICDAVLPGGVRFHGVLPPPGHDRPVVVHLRRRRAAPLTLADLTRRRTLSPAMATFLTAALKAGLSLLIAGAPGSGKTRTLDALLLTLDDFEEHLVIIESQPELAVADPAARDAAVHVTAHLTGGPAGDGGGTIGQRELVRAAQREAPTRVIVGELRGAEAYDWLLALNLGADGSLTTIHANSCRHALVKLATYVLMAGEEIPPRQVAEMIASSVTLVLFQKRDPRTGVRRIMELCEVGPCAGGDVPALSPIFAWDAARGRHVRVGPWPACADRLSELDLPTGLEEEAGDAAAG